ncbi:MAG TPA: hypothetical protein VFN54_04270, partial [Acidimicrobiales bacterium]|nr:hypothetical protein [Acidimicrobiales bacterium]
MEQVEISGESGSDRLEGDTELANVLLMQRERSIARGSEDPDVPKGQFVAIASYIHDQRIAVKVVD